MVDHLGHFIKYTGLTVICKMIAPDRLKGLETLINELRIFRKYVVPTPGSSYHMTITGIPSNSSKHQLEHIRKMCNDFSAAISPSKEWEREVMFKDIYFGETAGISVTVSTGSHIITKLRGDILDVLESGPKQGSSLRPAYEFHITFGYKYKQLEPQDMEQYAEDVSKIKRYIYSIFPRFISKIKLGNPYIYSFNDMTEFTPLPPPDRG